MRALLLVALLCALMGCKKRVHGYADKGGRVPAQSAVDAAVDRQVEQAEQAAATEAAAGDESLPQLGTGWAFGGLYRVADDDTGVVCYVANSTNPAISCVIPTHQP